MTKKIIIIVILLLIGLLIISLFINKYEYDLEKRNLLDKDIKRNIKKRFIEPIKIYDIDGEILEIKVEESQFYIYDFNTQSIQKYDDRGKLMYKIGKKGMGEDEFGRISGWSIKGKEIIVADGATFTIKKFYENKLVESKKFDKIFYSFERLSENLYIFRGSTYLNNSINSTSKIYYFWKYNTENNKIEEIPVDFNDESREDSDFKYEGFFTKAHYNSKKTFFVLLKAGYILSFDSTGKNINTFRTIDRTPYPILVIGEDKSISYDKNTSIVNYSVSINESNIFVLTAKYDKKRNDIGGVIDVYGIEDGEYLWSIELPRYNNSRASSIGVNQKSVYAYYGEKILVFNFE